MTTDDTLTALTTWWIEQSGSLPHPSHVHSLADLVERHGLDLADCTLTINQDRAWGERGEGRHYLGRTGANGRIWIATEGGSE